MFSLRFAGPQLASTEGQELSIRARQPSHREFDRTVGHVPPAFHFCPVSCSREIIKPLARFGTGIVAGETKGFAHEVTFAPSGLFTPVIGYLPLQAFHAGWLGNMCHNNKTRDILSQDDARPKKSQHAVLELLKHNC